MPSSPAPEPRLPARRRALTTLTSFAIGGTALALAPRLCAQVRRYVATLPDFRRAGDQDDTAALLRAAETGLPVYAPAGRYAIAMTAADDLPSGMRLYGDGMNATVFMRSYARPAPFILHADSRSSRVERNLTGWNISDLRFEDDVIGRGFAEHDYLVMLSGVTDATFERVAFRGFRGDGLYLGSSTIRANERHNRNVRVANCLFDGANANNRNAISVIDCDGLIIEGSRFLNVTRRGNGVPGAGDPMNPLTGPGMPGAIDFEPDEGFSIIRNATVRRNRFEGGGGYAVALSLGPNAGVRTPRGGFVLEDNVIADRYGAFFASGFGGDDAMRDVPGYAVTIRGNTVSRTEKPFLVQGMRGMTIDQNSFTDCAEMAELGYRAANADVTLTGNDFVRVGFDKGYGLWIRTIAQATIAGNNFVDCGRADKASGTAIAFMEGRARSIQVDRNRISSPLGRTTLGLRVFAEAQVDRATVKGRGNVNTVAGAAGDTTLGL